MHQHRQRIDHKHKRMDEPGRAAALISTLLPNQDVSPTELCLFVNYQGSPTILNVLEGNMTVFSQTIDPHSSMFISLPFADVETTYTVIVVNQGYTLLTHHQDRARLLSPDAE